MNMEAIRVMTMAQTRDDLSVRLLRGRQGLETIRAAWEELVKHIDSAEFYHQFAWYENYVCHLEPEPQCMLFAVVSRGMKVVAILPLRYHKATRVCGLRSLQLPSHDHLCVADALIRSGEDHAGIMNRVIRQLRRSGKPGWDMLLFPEVPAGSCVDLGLRDRSRAFMVREAARGSDYIPNTGGYETTTQRLSGGFKRDLRRKRKHAENDGTLTYRSVESPEELDAAFKEFLEIEGSGWKGRDGARTAINCNPDAEGFYRGIMLADTASSRCVINLMYLNEKCVAAEFCLYCNGVLSLLKIGYLESHARVSPGSLLFDCVLRDWCERPDLREISLVGDAAWQRVWHPDERPVFRYRIYNRSLRALAARLWRSVRPLLVRFRNEINALRQSTLDPRPGMSSGEARKD